MENVINNLLRDHIGPTLRLLGILSTTQADAVHVWLHDKPNRLDELNNYLKGYDTRLERIPESYSFNMYVSVNKMPTESFCKSIW